MFNKIYASLKENIKENLILLFGLIILILLFTIKIPFYIDSPGGLIELNDRISINDKNTINGSYNLTYVSEMHATIPSYLIAKINKDWDIIKKEDEILSNETIKEYNKKGKIMLEESKQNALLVALSKANIKYQTKNNKVHVILVEPGSLTDLKIGDQIISVNDKKINNKKDLMESIKEDTNFKIKVINDDKEQIRYANKKDFEGIKLIGIMVAETKDIITDENINVEFKKSESGPSGGLMVALSLYDSLVKEDLAKGRTVAGTGTINELGFVGPIGGIKYKIKGACKDKADIFFVPEENYDEAKKVIDEDKLNIDLVLVKHIDDAINYLRK